MFYLTWYTAILCTYPLRYRSYNNRPMFIPCISPGHLVPYLYSMVLILWRSIRPGEQIWLVWFYPLCCLYSLNAVYSSDSVSHY